MRTLATQLSFTIEEWFLPIAILLLTFLAVRVSRVILKNESISRRFKLLSNFGPSFSNLIYVFGFKVFVQTAPLHESKWTLWFEDAIYILGVIIIISIIRRLAWLGIEWSTFKTNPSNTLQQGFIPLLKNLISIFIFGIATIMILKHLNYDVMSLVAAFGVSSLAVGLAAKDTLSNMISGFTLIIDRNLRPGDRINLGGQAGEVEEIGLRSTRIRTPNGNTLIVPNAELVNTKILNLSLPSRGISCGATVRFAHQVHFSRIKPICLSILNEVEFALADKSKWVNLAQLTDTAQVVEVGFWIADLDQQGKAVSDFHEKLMIVLEREKIPLAPPVLAFPPVT